MSRQKFSMPVPSFLRPFSLTSHWSDSWSSMSWKCAGELAISKRGGAGDKKYGKRGWPYDCTYIFCRSGRMSVPSERDSRSSPQSTSHFCSHSMHASPEDICPKAELCSAMTKPTLGRWKVGIGLLAEFLSVTLSVRLCLGAVLTSWETGWTTSAPSRSSPITMAGTSSGLCPVWASLLPSQVI